MRGSPYFWVASALLALTALLIGPRTALAGIAESGGSAEPPAIIIGFVGGFVRRDNAAHSEVQLAAKLRQTYCSRADVRVFENHHVRQAHQYILSVLGAETHGILTSEEKRDARIALYGHSWGGAAVVQLAGALQKDGIPVLLTVEVDSVSKFRSNDSVIPSNVLQAANFYQTHGIIHGVRKIRAQDASRTRIIGNYRFDYTRSSLRCSDYPWWDRYLLKAHTEIECDPVVWNRIDSLIRGVLQPPPSVIKKARTIRLAAPTEMNSPRAPRSNCRL